MTEQTDARIPAQDRDEPAGTPGSAPAAGAPEAPAVPAPEAPTASPEVLVASAGATGPEVPADPPARRSSKRVLWAVARWTAAVVVCGGLGTGTALKITSMERTDVPGLATESDGRWEYPELRLPALPRDAPRPFTEGNAGEIHYADLRELLLPAPAGATVDPELKGGWVTVDEYVSRYDKDARVTLKQALDESALRHIAARGWTTPDGTTTRIHLLRFNSVAFAEDFKDSALQAGSSFGRFPDGVRSGEIDAATTDIRMPFNVLYPFAETKPYGAEQTRWVHIQAGDTVALITQSREGGALTVPFQQTVALQNQLLG
ncbi:hypothetical protein [Streptomyces sp. NBC_01216]|uniref:hypothetical protein n=1 Tax=unclassified Streptomyces TaxID=2593676 RepID=UPI002E155A6E|nr:hypothetical protein OG393_13930 [Streptomyces sp. NBC_01216]